MDALEILEKTRSQIEDDHKFAQIYDEAIAEVKALKEPKHCETCKRYSPWECTDGSTLSVGDCSFGIKYGKEMVDGQYEWFVPEDFGCTEHSKKDTK